MRIAFTVRGKPIPQGSLTKSAKDALHYSNASPLFYWRSAIASSAEDAGAAPSALPIRLSVQFGMPRPKAHLALRNGRYVVRERYLFDRPAVMPDLDKLVRAVSDALDKVCYFDDGQVVEVYASKVYGDSTYIEVTDEGLSPQTEAFTTSLPLALATHKEAHPSKG